jgi:hypothetical protein
MASNPIQNHPGTRWVFVPERIKLGFMRPLARIGNGIPDMTGQFDLAARVDRLGFAAYGYAMYRSSIRGSAMPSRSMTHRFGLDNLLHGPAAFPFPRQESCCHCGILSTPPKLGSRWTS